MQALYVLTVVLMIAALSLLFRLAEKKEEENRLLESGIRASQMYNEVLQGRIDEIRRLRHDAAGLLQAIDMDGLDADGGLEEQKTAVQAERAAAGAAMPLLEAIIELKRRQCSEEGIDFECPDISAAIAEAFREDRDAADETDLCLLVQNLLDNAYEANLRIEDRAKRMISLGLSFAAAAPAEGSVAALPAQGDPSGCPVRLTISVANRIDEGEKVSFLTRKSQAELHGIGLRIVDDILKKYNGLREVATDSSRHILTTTLHL